MRKFLFFITVLFLLSACASRKERQDKPIVMVTIEPLRYLTRQIAGDLVDVKVMVPGGSSPETYEPTARQMMELSHATAYIMVGSIGFERTWMDRLRQNAPHLFVANSSRGIRPEMSREGIEDPHVWMSCANAKIMASNIKEVLSKLLPANKQVFSANEQRLVRRLDSLDLRIRESLNGRPVSFAIYHPMLTYYARDYHLRQYPIEEEGREPSARQLKALIRQMKVDSVKVIFQLREFNTANIRSVANATGARVVDINPLSEDWETEMLNITKAL